MRRPYDATQAYAVSKLANVLHTRELAARLQVETVPLSPSICIYQQQPF
jgi:hypothetical protein